MVMAAGLSPSDLAVTVEAMLDNHRIRRNVSICTLDHTLIEDVSEAFIEGQVNIASSAEVSRSATISLFDPTHQIGLDSANPATASVAPKYLLRLTRGLYVEALGRWVDFPVGMLPFTRPSRVGDVLTIEAQGKESLAQLPAWRTMTLKKGTNKAEAIRMAMEELCGEKFFRLETTSATLKANQTVSRDTNAWAIAKSIADSIGWQLFYDAEGYLVGRPKPVEPVFTFYASTSYRRGSLVGGAPAVGYGAEVYNRVLATGTIPKGKKKPREATAALPASHPLSAEELARGGVPGERRYDVSSDDADTNAEVQKLADETLAEVVLQSIDFTFDSLVLPHLEEGDPIAFEAHGGNLVAASWDTASIPLTVGIQSNGANRRVSRTYRRPA